MPLEAYYDPDRGGVCIYDDPAKIGSPCLYLDEKSMVDLARFLLNALDGGADEIGLKGGMAQITNEV